jgi:hypothetical protein
MWLMLVHLFIPVGTFARLCRRSDVDVFDRLFEDMPYEDAAVEFIDDYDRANPVTTE